MIVKMKDICTKIGSGATPRGGKDAYIDEGISLIRSQNVIDFSFSHDGLTYINEEQAKKLNGVTVEVDDVLLNITGDSVARVCIVDNEILPARVNQHVCILRGDKDKVLNSFILYFLQMKKQELLQMASGGATRNALTKGMIEELEIDLPSIEEQKKIVSTLDSIQEKLKINNKINRNLLEQALALFFQYYEQASKKESFSKHIKVLGGGTPKTNEAGYWNGDIPFFTPKDVGTPYTFNTEKNITEEGLAHCNSRLYPINTTFVTARGTVGKVALAGVPMAMNQSCYALASDSINPLLVYFYTIEAVKSLKHKASGAVFDAIVTRDFDTEIIHYLDEQSADEFVICVTPMMEQIRRSTIESQKLQKLRNGLLPKLMAGELDVSDLDI